MAEAETACINCGAPMINRSCKVRCERCGVFYDCGDAMLPMPETGDRGGLEPED